jgi:A/G-specific adenine glycosylase
LLSDEELLACQKALITWFKKNARTLPWRLERTAYRVWISEIMLQQTQVKTVVDYYQKWMERFPSLSELAKSDEASVLKFWEGLGYYRRARSILKTAKIIRHQHDGIFPNDYDSILSLPGIGPYTAGAISNFAYGLKRPIVDGNIIRVFSRIFLIKKNVLLPIVQKEIWKMAEQSLPKKNWPLWNEGLMELGALVCLPEKPKCGDCPLSENCQAHQKGIAETLPVKQKKPTPILQNELIAVLSHTVNTQTHYLVVKKNKGQWMEGTWAFPSLGPDTKIKTLFDLKTALSKQLKQNFIFEKEVFLSLKYTVTHHRILADVFTAKVTQRIEQLPKNYQWATAKKLNLLAMASAHTKIRKQLFKRI